MVSQQAQPCQHKYCRNSARLVLLIGSGLPTRTCRIPKKKTPTRRPGRVIAAGRDKVLLKSSDTRTWSWEENRRQVCSPQPAEAHEPVELRGGLARPCSNPQYNSTLTWDGTAVGDTD